MRSLIIKVVIGVLALGLVVGGYFYVQHEMRVYKALIVTQGGVADIINFIKMEFPDQVADYQAKIKAQQVPQK